MTSLKERIDLSVLKRSSYDIVKTLQIKKFHLGLIAYIKKK